MLPVRDDQPRFGTPYVTYFLIALNALIYLFEAALTPESFKTLLFQLGMVPANITAYLSGGSRMGLVAVLLPAFTSMFLHGSWMHVIGNMWFLWIFGDNIEDYLGHFTVSGFLPDQRIGGGIRAGDSQSSFAGADGGRERSHCRRFGRLLCAVSKGTGVDLVPYRILLLSAGMGHAGLLVSDAICEWSRNLDVSLQRDLRRSGVLGPRRWIRRGHRADQDPA